MSETLAIHKEQPKSHSDKAPPKPKSFKNKARLDRSSLPHPLSYLINQGLLQSNHGEYAMIKCPVHKGGQERNPSMAVYMPQGNFKCFSCGAKGGDIVDLHRLITGNNFSSTVKELGGRLYV